MRRREYLAATAVTLALAGCTNDDARGEVEGTPEDESTPPDENNNETNGNENGNQNDQNGESDDENDEDDEDDAHVRDPVGFVPDAAVHQWPLLDRQDDTVEEVLNGSHATASSGVETIAGEYLAGHAEYASQEDADGYIDLGYLSTINDAASDYTLTLFATINAETIEADRSMTVLGAGGGGTNWFEFRIGESFGSYVGTPMLYVVDDDGNIISAIADYQLEAGVDTRIAVQLDGPTGFDISFWIDGEPIDTTVIHAGELTDDVVPSQSYGLFASNPRSEGSVSTRRWFSGTIDNVIFCDEAVSADVIREDYSTGTWS